MLNYYTVSSTLTCRTLGCQIYFNSIIREKQKHRDTNYQNLSRLSPSLVLIVRKILIVSQHSNIIETDLLGICGNANGEIFNFFFNFNFNFNSLLVY